MCQSTRQLTCTQGKCAQVSMDPMTVEVSEVASEPTLDDMLCFDLYAASRNMTQRYRPLLDELGMTYPQFLVLVALWAGEPRTVKDLGSLLSLDHGTLTPLLRRMEASGLITRRRSAADERFVQIALTPAGDALRSRGATIHCEISASVGLDAQDLALVRASLRTLAARD